MSADDFCACTFAEFNAIYEAWRKRQDYLNRERWEQTRFLAVCSIQPHTRKRIKPTDLLNFEWDKELHKNAKPDQGRLNKEDLAALIKCAGGEVQKNY